MYGVCVCVCVCVCMHVLIPSLKPFYPKCLSATPQHCFNVKCVTLRGNWGGGGGVEPGEEG